MGAGLTEVLGIRLFGTLADRAVLDRLLADRAGLFAGPWWTLATGDGASIIASPALVPHAAALAELGVVLEAVPALVDYRPSAHLLEALCLLPEPHDVVPAEGCFMVPAHHPEATRTVERLLRLGRGLDTTVSPWTGPDGPHLLLRMASPPLYLLLRARDGDGTLRAFARHRSTHLWVEWGHQHPLGDAVADRLRAAGQGAFVTRSGRWLMAPEALGGGPILDLVDARLPATDVRLEPAKTPAPRFTVLLRLEADRLRPATLWLATPAEFLALEPLVESSAADALGSMTFSRLEGPNGACYVLRLRGTGEADAGLGERLSSLLGQPGYVRIPGADRLYVPAGQRLMPPMRVDALREVLQPGTDGTVLLRATAAGPEIVRIAEAPEASLRDWVDYIAIDHRATLDVLLEEAVFAVPALVLDRPLVPIERTLRPRAPVVKREKRPRPIVAAPVAADATPRTEAEVLRAARAEAEPLQAQVIAGGLTQPVTWARLAELMEILAKPDDAAYCWEAAAFYTQSLADRRSCFDHLARIRLADQSVSPERVPELLLAIATDSRAGPAPTQVLGGVAARDAQQGQLLDGLAPLLVARFTSPHAPASRRLAWNVLASVHGDDLLGVTRAKEALLGMLNVDGLREAYDTPRFVRLELALGGGEETTMTAGGELQRGALAAVWDALEGSLEELDGQSLIYRAQFAVGFGRAGDLGRARALAHDVEELLPLFDGPVRGLLRLYLGRLEGLGSDQPEALWQRAVSAAQQDLNSTERQALTFSRRRSAWLGEGLTVEEATEERVSHLAAPLATTPELAAEVLRAGVPMLKFDHQVAGLLEVTLHHALSTGREAVIDAVLAEADGLIDRLAIPAQRARALGATIGAAALAGDEDRVHTLLGQIVLQINDMDSVGEMLHAVGPAMAAVRRVGFGAEADRFLEALVQVARRGHRESAKVAAFAADGYRLLGEALPAEQTLGLTDSLIYEASLDPIARFEAASVMLDTLRAWPATARELAGRKAMECLNIFQDRFTTRRYFELHKLLVVERVVDTLSDTRSFSSGRLKVWMEGEEQAVRRRIVADWRRLA